MSAMYRIAGLGIALAVNLAALAAVDTSMVQTVLREQLASTQAPRIVVTEPGMSRRTLAGQSCPAPRG